MFEYSTHYQAWNLTEAVASISLILALVPIDIHVHVHVHVQCTVYMMFP